MYSSHQKKKKKKSEMVAMSCVVINMHAALPKKLNLHVKIEYSEP